GSGIAIACGLICITPLSFKPMNHRNRTPRGVVGYCQKLQWELTRRVSFAGVLRQGCPSCDADLMRTSSLCNLCVLCVSVVKIVRKKQPQRHREHRGCTEKSSQTRALHDLPIC